MQRRAFSSPRLLSVKCTDVNDAEENSGHKKPLSDTGQESKRGKIVGWSRNSRMRVSRLLASVSSPDYLYHVTCTYGREFPTDYETIRQHYQAFSKAITYDHYYGLWVKHYQSRGAVHYHNLLWHSEITDCSDIERHWHRISGNDSAAAVDVREGDSGLAAWYLALHSTKEHQRPEIAQGRWWGFYDRDRLMSWTRNELIADELTAKEIIWLKRLYRRSTGCRTFGGSANKPYDSGRQGLSWFLPESEQARLLAWVHNQCELSSKLNQNPF